MQVRDTGGWWRIVIDYGAKSAKFCLGEGERGAIPTSASKLLSVTTLKTGALPRLGLPSRLQLVADVLVCE